MPALYAETSAILRFLLGDEGAGTVKSAIDESAPVLTSRLTSLEVRRALVRMEATGEGSGADASMALGTYERMSRAWILRELDVLVLDRAGRPFPVEPVRSFDAVHLATALWFLRLYPDLRVLSFDDRITRNAAALGLPLFPLG